MEVFAALNKVGNYQDFLLFTEKITSPNSLDYSNVPLNMLLLRNLKNIIEFERRASIQDLGKHVIQSNIAVFVTSAILKSKVQCVWEDISIHVVAFIECALTAYVKLINTDFTRWWGSLSVVISSISELCSKHTSLRDLILGQLSSIILSLACDKNVPLHAVKHVVNNFNICSSGSKRQLRSKLYVSLQDYFSQIAESIATCGDFDCQQTYFKTLLIWLVRRSHKEVRVAAAQRWFSTALFPHEARQIFVERKFEHFFLDCRDFMSAVNRFSGLVTSIDAVSIYMGQIKLKEIEHNKRICLDINRNSLSIYCDATSFCNPEPKNFQHASQWETIIVIPDIVNEAQLKREGNEPVLKLHLEREPEYRRATSKTMILENYKTLDVQFDKSEGLKRASAALQRLFGVKYQVQQNVMHLIHTPDKNQTRNASECFIGTYGSANVSAVRLHSDENRPSPLCTSSSRVCQNCSSTLEHQSAGQKGPSKEIENHLSNKDEKQQDPGVEVVVSTRAQGELADSHVCRAKGEESNSRNNLRLCSSDERGRRANEDDMNSDTTFVFDDSDTTDNTNHSHKRGRVSDSSDSMQSTNQDNEQVQVKDASLKESEQNESMKNIDVTEEKSANIPGKQSAEIPSSPLKESALFLKSNSNSSHNSDGVESTHATRTVRGADRSKSNGSAKSFGLVSGESHLKFVPSNKYSMKQSSSKAKQKHSIRQCHIRSSTSQESDSDEEPFHKMRRYTAERMNDKTSRRRRIESESHLKFVPSNKYSMKQSSSKAKQKHSIRQCHIRSSTSQESDSDEEPFHKMRRYTAERMNDKTSRRRRIENYLMKHSYGKH